MSRQLFCKVINALLYAAGYTHLDSLTLSALSKDKTALLLLSKKHGSIKNFSKALDSLEIPHTIEHVDDKDFTNIAVYLRK